MPPDIAQQPPCEVCGVDADVGLEHGKKWLCWDHWLVSPDYQKWIAERLQEGTDADRVE